MTRFHSWRSMHVLAFAMILPASAAVSQQQQPPPPPRRDILHADTIPLRLQVESSTLVDRKQSYVAGADFLPLTNAAGVHAPMDADVKRRHAVFGGRIGSANALDPERAQGFVVVFLPPLRPDGEPTYDLRLVSDALQRYNKAAAIVIASFELIPRSMMRRLSAGEWLPASDEATLPPIYAVSRIVMSRLRLSNEVSLSYRSSTGTDSTASRQPEVQPGKRR